MYRILGSQILVDALPPARGTRLIAVDDATGNFYYDTPPGTWTPLNAGGVAAKNVGANLNVPTTGTVEEVLRSYTLPAGTMATNGDRLQIRATFALAVNGNSKNMQLRLGGIGGTSLMSSTTSQSGGAVVLAADVVRETATTFGVTRWGILTSSIVQSYTTGAAIWANALDIVATGTTATAAGDVSLREFSVDYLKAPA